MPRTIFILQILLCSAACYSQPIISSFSPLNGPAGAALSIAGSGFSATPANNIVYFGAVRATVSSASTNSLAVVVPSGATFEPITITTNNLTASSAMPFGLTFPGGGAITDYSFEPSIDKTAGPEPFDINNADFDGDGKTDLVVVNLNFPYSFSIFRNSSTAGNITFAPKTDYPTGIEPVSVAVADIDGDGKKDIVVANNGSFTVSIFRNISSPGSISFDARIDLPAAVPFMVCIADLDKDGRPDLVTANMVSNSISIFRNTGGVGNISFAARTDFPTGSEPISVGIADMDGDTKPDLAVSNSISDNVTIFRNNSSPGIISLMNIANYATGSEPGKIVMADIDGDGKPDMNLTSGGAISVYKNSSTAGNISFATPVNFTNANSAISIADIDGDGKPDIAAVKNSDTLSIIRNISTTGNIQFEPEAKVKTSSFPHSMTISDLDGDNMPDITTANQFANSISIIRNKVNGPNVKNFSPTAAPQGFSVFITGTNFTGVSSVTFGGVPAQSFFVINPNAIDAKVGNGASGEVAVTGPLGTAKKAGFTLLYFPQVDSFSPLSGPAGTTVVIHGKGFLTTTSVKFGNTNAQSYSVISDTLISAVVGTGNSGNVSVTSTIGTASLPGFTFTFAPIPKIISFSPQAGPSGTIVNITGVNFNPSIGGNSVHFGAAKATVTAASSNLLTVTVPTGTSFEPISVSCNNLVAYSTKPFVLTFPTGPAFTMGNFSENISKSGTPAATPLRGFDIDGDNKTDFAYAATNELVVSVVMNHSTPGNLVFADEVRIYLSDQPTDVDFGDIDGDGKKDLVTANASTFSILKNLSTAGTTAFAPKIDFALGSNSNNFLLLNDIDQDGKLDVLIAKSSTDSIIIYRNVSSAGTISFTQTAKFSSGDEPICIVAADVDSDGKSDLLIANRYSGTISIYKNNCSSGLVSFIRFPDISSNDQIEWLQAGDLDGDAKVELVTSNYNRQGNGGSVQVFKNNTSGANIVFDSIITLPVSGLYSGRFSIADLNGDAKPEIVATDGYLHYICIFKNTTQGGNMEFANIVRYQVTPYAPIGVIAGDIDDDGKPDLFAGTVVGYSVFGNTISHGRVVPSGTNPVIGNLNNNVIIDPVVNTYNGYPYVQRHYDINPVNNQPGATATLTLYYTQQDFNNYNAFPGHGPDLPTGPSDLTNKANIRIFQYHGFGAGSLPGSYPGYAVEIDPADSNIVWNPDADCWEVTFDITGFSGFFMSTETGHIFGEKSMCRNSNIILTAALPGASFQWQVNTGTGFSNIIPSANYAGINTSSLELNNIPGVWYGYQYRCLVDAVPGKTITIKFSSTWNGSVDNNWENVANWDCGILPDGYTDVLIHSGSVILNVNTSVRSISLDPGVNLDVQPDVYLTILH